MKRVVIIGAGIGGLSTAVQLARSGINVTVLEAHVYPGGSAGTFYHRGYRFDAGATLAGGFYPGGPMDHLAITAGIDHWPVQPADLAMRVHLPDGFIIDRWGDDRRHEEYLRAFGREGRKFWDWQEATAESLWDLALRSPAWPPQSALEFSSLVRHGLGWVSQDLLGRLKPKMIADLFRPVSSHMKGADERLRLFIDAQLLISAQTVSRSANALYGAAALDLPRRGVVHVTGGMGTIASLLAHSVKNFGGDVIYRQEAVKIVMENGKPVAVETRRGGSYPADIVVANLPPWNIARLLLGSTPGRLRDLPKKPRLGWGAFVVYAGIDRMALKKELPLHHQVVVREPLGEGNSIFISISPSNDDSRAPAGRRAVTISTHTHLGPWWDLFENDRFGYESAKNTYVERLLRAANLVIPGIKDSADLILPGTPVTFERFTRRSWGWVGGFPQINLFQTWGPRIGKDLWMVGDSIFPGQSTAAVALGGLRVAQSVLESAGGLKRNRHEFTRLPVGD